MRPLGKPDVLSLKLNTLVRDESTQELLVASSAFNEVIACLALSPLGGLYRGNLASKVFITVALATLQKTFCTTLPLYNPLRMSGLPRGLN